MSELMTKLLQSRAALLADVEPGVAEPRVLVRSDLSGTMQCYEWSAAGGLRQVTDLPEPVAVAAYLPGARRAVLQSDVGGNERHRLHLLDLDRSAPATTFDDLAPLTDSPAHGHHLAGVRRDGGELAYCSNRRNGVDFDLWVHDLSSGERRLVMAEGGYFLPGSGYTPDGRSCSLLRLGLRPLEECSYLVDLGTGQLTELHPHAEESAAVGPPAFVTPGVCFVASNVGRDLAAVVRLDLDSGEERVVPGTGEEWDCSVVASPDGSRLLVIENRNGAHRLRLVDPDTLADLGEVPLPEPGMVSYMAPVPPAFSADGRVLFHSFSSPRRAGDLWRYDLSSGAHEQLTRSPAPFAPDELVAPSEERVESFDGEQIPLYCFRPAPSADPAPVVIVVHGGPEAQATLWFNPVIQALVLSGYGVVQPNVRGSTGYGKRYASLDDTTKRLDSVADLAALRRYVGEAGFDPSRAVLYGGSYGGYMVLAGLAFQPDLWAAGVDIVGISDLVTFLENTSAYRRAVREREYGSLEHDREFLESASPLRRADEITAPLLVLHGRNDPRVPVGEAEQLVASLRHRGVRCDLVIYEDEGHGLQRLENRIDGYGRVLAFLDEVVGPAARRAV